MKKLLFGMFLICAAVPAQAGSFWDLRQWASSATVSMLGTFTMSTNSYLNAKGAAWLGVGSPGVSPNVGVGTTSPQQKLEIYDSGAVLRFNRGANPGANTMGIQFNEDNTQFAALWVDRNVGGGIGADATPEMFTIDASSDVSIRTNSSRRFWVYKSGLVAIGTGATISTFSTTGALTMANNAAITTGSSVTASAFFGDGSHLGGITGAGVVNSSFTWLFTDNTSVGGGYAYGTCIDNSTVTLTTHGSRVVASLVASVSRATGSSAILKAGVVMDGKYIDNEGQGGISPDRSITTVYVSSQTTAFNCASVNFRYQFKTNPSAASHTFCFTISNVDSDKQFGLPCASQQGVMFGVEEFQ